MPWGGDGGCGGGTHDGDGQGNQVAPPPAGERSEPGFFCAAGAKILGFWTVPKENLMILAEKINPTPFSNACFPLPTLMWTL